jgi:hypothetical protein
MTTNHPGLSCLDVLTRILFLINTCVLCFIIKRVLNHIISALYKTPIYCIHRWNAFKYCQYFNDYSGYVNKKPQLSHILQSSSYFVVLVISCENTEGLYNQTTLNIDIRQFVQFVIFHLNFLHEWSITQKVFVMSTCKFIDGFILLRRNAVHKNDNSTLNYF